MSSRPIKQKEIIDLAPLGDMSHHSEEYIVALDGLSVIVYPQNPLKSIKKDRLKAIFSGKITHWSQLGIPGGRINVFACDHKSGTYDTFKSLAISDEGTTALEPLPFNVSTEDYVLSRRLFLSLPEKNQKPY